MNRYGGCEVLRVKLNPVEKSLGSTPLQPLNEVIPDNGIFTGVNPILQVYDYLHKN